MTLMQSQPPIDTQSPVRAVAEFDPPVVRPGELAIYRVSFNALEETIEWPAKLATPPELDVRPGARGEMLQMGPGKLVPQTGFNYRVRASRLGQFNMPSLVVNVYGQPVAVPSAQLTVVAAPPAGTPPPRQISLDAPVTNLFAGQAVPVRVLLPGSPNGSVQFLTQVRLSGEGFLTEQSSIRQRIEPLPRGGATSPLGGAEVYAQHPGVEPAQRGGATVPTYIYETLLTPIQTGKLKFFAQGFTAGNQFAGTIVISGQASIPGGRPQNTLLDSEPLELNVKPLPTQGELPGFTGAVGSFRLDPPKLATNVVRAGDAVKLTVTVRGDGNLAHLVAPPAPQSRDWQLFSSGLEPGAGPAFGPQAAVSFSYTLIPLTDDARATPAIPFSYFDPKRACYVDLTVPPAPLTVTPGAAPGDLQALRQPDAAPAGEEKELTLSGLAAAPGLSAASLVPVQQRAWFRLVQLAPAAAFFGLWGWARRRRFLERHPEILLCRRARRALRRERRLLRRAARAGDGPGFARAGVSALRVACAPHYPAEPRALVGADVIELLPRTGQRLGSSRAGEVVRRFFSITDAAEFSATHTDTAQLLTLQPELEGLLEDLEKQLWPRASLSQPPSQPLSPPLSPPLSQPSSPRSELPPSEARSPKND
jgi:hypothetical protein